MKKKDILLLIILSFMMSGFQFLIFPISSNQFYQNEVALKVKHFETEISQTSSKTSDNGKATKEASDFSTLHTALQQKNEMLFIDGQKELKDPFSYEEPDIDLAEYGLKDNCIGFVDIPKIEMTLPIYLGANEANMEQGAVHLTNTSYPIGGENTNSVIAAHRGYYRSNMFRDLNHLVPKDIVKVKNFKETLIYEVERLEVIEPTEINKLLIVPSEDRLTLFTCEPMWSSEKRLVAYCKRKIDSSSEATVDKATKEADNTTKALVEEEGERTNLTIHTQKKIDVKLKIGVIILIVCGLLAGLAYTLKLLLDETKTVPHHRDYSQYEKILTDEEKQKWQTAPIENGKAHIQINSRIPISLSQKKAKIRLIIPPYSDMICKVELKLADSSETVYKTSYLAPGTVVNQAKINEKIALPEGMIKGYAVYYFYDAAKKLRGDYKVKVEFNVSKEVDFGL
ncbi:hypothetical protein RyT2_13630 [Pseudolactococcus yaeyamensis]